MLRSLKRELFLLLVVLLTSGCASKSYVVLLESPDGSTGAIVGIIIAILAVVGLGGAAAAMGGFI